MKSLVEQLSTYKSVHLNHKNVKTHFIGVPLIIWSIAIVLSMVGFELQTDNFTIGITLLSIVSFIVLIYYVILSKTLALLALLFFGPIVYSATWVPATDSPWVVASVAFIVGWIIQFIGHGYEKAKPAFVDDLNQLFIGPLFLLAEIYFKFAGGTDLEQKINQLAVDKRKAFEEKRQAEQ